MDLFCGPALYLEDTMRLHHAVCLLTRNAPNAFFAFQIYYPSNPEGYLVWIEAGSAL